MLWSRSISVHLIRLYFNGIYVFMKLRSYGVVRLKVSSTKIYWNFWNLLYAIGYVWIFASVTIFVLEDVHHSVRELNFSTYFGWIFGSFWHYIFLLDLILILIFFRRQIGKLWNCPLGQSYFNELYVIIFSIFKAILCWNNLIFGYSDVFCLIFVLIWNLHVPFSIFD